MEQYTEKIRNSWGDGLALLEVLCELVEAEASLAVQIAQAEATLNSAFVAEKEDSYKSTDAMARAKAKSLVGSSQTRYEHEFIILGQLVQLLTSRISQLGRG